MILQDSFGRQFTYLRLSITDICNFKCNYCLPDGNTCLSPKPELTLKQIETLISAFAKLGTRKIRITGGEPALRKDLVDIISLCKQTPGIEHVALTTNAFKLKRDVAKYYEAGLDTLSVSADSLDPRMFAAITGKDKLNDILDGVEKALDLGLPTVKLNSVLLKKFNVSELPRFLDFVKHRKVTWRFIELMQTGTNKEYFDANHVAGEDIQAHLLASGWQQIIKPVDAGPAREFKHPDYAGKIGLIMPYSKDFCDSCNRLRVSSVGKVHLCLFAEQGYDIMPYLEKGDVNGTIEALQNMMSAKSVSHYLHEGKTGATTHFAMLGG